MVTSIDEYIDALEQINTWMSYTDLKMISECFRVSDRLDIKGEQYFTFFRNQ